MIKFLHTRIRVSEPQASIDFYSKLGFTLGQQKTSPQGNQLSFMHLPDSEHFLELTYSPEFKVEFPEDLMHIAIGVEDVISYCDTLENDGIEIWPSDWRTKFAEPDCHQMAFVTDPDGYEVEILPLKN